MYQVAKDRTYNWKVNVDLPHPDRPGDFEQYPFTALFKMIPVERLQQLQEQHGAEWMIHVVKEAWIGWGTDVVDGAKNPIPYSEELRDEMLEDPALREAVFRDYTSSLSPTAKKALQKGN